jgi:hypothetical protein
MISAGWLSGARRIGAYTEKASRGGGTASRVHTETSLLGGDRSVPWRLFPLPLESQPWVLRVCCRANRDAADSAASAGRRQSR